MSKPATKSPAKTATKTAVKKTASRRAPYPRTGAPPSDALLRRQKYMEDTNTKPLLFRVPTALHRAMRIVAEDNPYPYGSLQSLVSMTISKYFDKRPGNPRLMPYPEPKGGPSIQVSVLIDPDLSKRVHMISILTGTPIRHIVTGAILDNLKDSPSIKDLHLGEMVEPPVLDGKLPK